MSCSIWKFAAALLAASYISGYGATIVSVTGSVTGGPGLGTAPRQQIGAVAFSAPVPLVNADIEVTLNVLSAETITAWLTNQIGPGTTAANVIASDTFSPGTLGDSQYAALPPISAAAGTYYLVLAAVGASNEVGWDSTDTPVITGIGTYISSQSASETAPFPFGPAGDFTPEAQTLLFQVSSSTTAVPEPAPDGMFAAALIALAAARRRRRRAPGVPSF